MNEELWQQWVEKESENLNGTKHRDIKKKRTYLHFDPRKEFSKDFQSELKKFMSSPANVARRAFYPFIRNEINKYKREFIKKRGKLRIVKNKPRETFYSSHFDAFIYSWYAEILNFEYEKRIVAEGMSESILAYRRLPCDAGGGNKCNIHFASEVFEYIKKQDSCSVLVFDIQKFFDNLDHKYLKETWASLLGASILPQDHYNIYKSLTNYSYVNRKEIYRVFGIKNRAIQRKDRICFPDEFRNKVRTTADGSLIFNNVNKNSLPGSSRSGELCGIPQGSPLSAVLSNMYLLTFDKALVNYVSKIGGLYRRYSDDIVIVCPSKCNDNAKQFVLDQLALCELTVNPSKIKESYFVSSNNRLICYCDNTMKKIAVMQYLGFEFDGKVTLLRPQTISKYYRRFKGGIKRCVKMAYGKHSKSAENKVFLKKLLKRYINRGGLNFVSYAFKSAKIMSSDAIKRQCRNRVKIFNKSFNDRVEVAEIDKAEKLKNKSK